MKAKIQAECQIVIDKGKDEGNTIEKEKMDYYIFRLERIANTSYKFRVHINDVGLLYQMIIGTNDENATRKDLINEINIINKIANILNDDIKYHINVLNIIGKFKKE